MTNEKNITCLISLREEARRTPEKYSILDDIEEIGSAKLRVMEKGPKNKTVMIAMPEGMLVKLQEKLSYAHVELNEEMELL